MQSAPSVKIAQAATRWVLDDWADVLGGRVHVSTSCPKTGKGRRTRVCRAHIDRKLSLRFYVRKHDDDFLTWAKIL